MGACLDGLTPHGLFSERLVSIDWIRIRSFQRCAAPVKSSSSKNSMLHRVSSSDFSFLCRNLRSPPFIQGERLHGGGPSLRRESVLHRLGSGCLGGQLVRTDPSAGQESQVAHGADAGSTHHDGRNPHSKWTGELGGLIGSVFGRFLRGKPEAAFLSFRRAALLRMFTMKSHCEGGLCKLGS
jgi:hypothetical protein